MSDMLARSVVITAETPRVARLMMLGGNWSLTSAIGDLNSQALLGTGSEDSLDVVSIRPEPRPMDSLPAGTPRALHPLIPVDQETDVTGGWASCVQNCVDAIDRAARSRHAVRRRSHRAVQLEDDSRTVAMKAGARERSASWS
jgi:hypothetical protein